VQTELDSRICGNDELALMATAPCMASFRITVYNETTQDAWNKQATIDLEARTDD
jgi:hypothetical protein